MTWLPLLLKTCVLVVTCTLASATYIVSCSSYNNPRGECCLYPISQMRKVITEQLINGSNNNDSRGHGFLHFVEPVC